MQRLHRKLEEIIMNPAKHIRTALQASLPLPGLAARISAASIALIAALLLPGASFASDVDIYSGIGGSAGNPNVLIVMDNAANFDASTTAAPCLINGVTNTMAKSATANSAGGIEQCALYSVISALPNNINIGFMIYNATGMTDYAGTTNCTAAGTGGGCLAFPLTPMTSANKTALLNWVAGWTPQTVKTNSQAVSEAMQESWAYYSGHIGLSGRNYAGIQPPNGCQKNFIIFLGNAFTSSAHPGDAPTTSLSSLQAAYTATGATYPGMILGTLKTTCSPGTYTFPTSDPSHNNGGFYMDEWARFMRNTDIFNTSTGQQNIVTYTVGLIDPTSCPADYPALLQSAANYGGGKYFETNNYSDIVNALMKILNEIQAINSVFSSATLPVSVNTQGTYLNQIYMGMFRPDALGNPRWVGNVKQYQFQFDNSGNLYLADGAREPAISSAGTGFITPGAASFWSCTYSGNGSTPAGPAQQAGYATFIPYSNLPNCALDPAVGYWANNGNYVGNSFGKAYDMPDGEVVEKGGASQQVRLSNLTATYPAAVGGADTPRRLYTYCPSSPNSAPGTNGCVGDLTDTSNAFSINNAGITASMYGTGLSLAITSITRSALTATATTAGAHGLSVGNTVTIAGALPNDYNGLVTVTSVPDATHFTYNIGYEWPPSPATTTTTNSIGGYVATQQTGATYSATVTRAPAGTAANATVTIVATTPSPTPFVVNQNITITGATPANYNLTQPVDTLTSTATTTTMQFLAGVNANGTISGVAIQPPPTATGSYLMDMFYNTSINVATATCSGGGTKTATITTSTAHNFVNGDSVTISGDTQTGTKYNGTYIITWASSTSFTFTIGSCPGTPSGTLLANSGPATSPAVTLTRNETAVGTATVTATVATANAFANGDKVSVWLASGTQPAGEVYYLVSGATITCVVTTAAGTCGANANGTTSVTYTISTAPATQPSGTITVYPNITASNQTIASLSRTPYPGGATATAVLATGATTTGFCNGDTISVNTAPNTTLAPKEGAYTGTWVITGTTACTAATCAATTTLCANGTTGTAYYGFTYGALALTPTSPATGSMSATNPTFTPDRTTLTNWVRGQDNYGDEQSLCPPGTTAGTFNCPTTAVTIRPSVHGDTLHSRPIAVNYGGNTGVVVFYGTNDGVYHAINGNQTPCTVAPCVSPAPPSTISYTNASGATVSVQPGGELWGYIDAAFLAKLNRQRTNSPPLSMPSTPAGITPQPQPKDYFIDGPTGLYQAIDGNGNTVKAIIYIGDRRGGRGLIALDVTNPLKPVRLWRIDNAMPGFSELGQTWSLPKIARVKGYCGGVTCGANPTTAPYPSPVLVFGAGYDDGSEDSEAPFAASYNGFGANVGADNMGRGIFIVDAFTGALVWESEHFPGLLGTGYGWYWRNYALTPGSYCTGTPPAAVVCQTRGMNYSIPADLTLVDRDSDGYVDRLYASDTGGNIWRMDFEPVGGDTPDKWQISNLAALGCPWGPCDTQLSPRSFPTYSDPAQVQRKFFFPVEFIPATSLVSYDSVFVASGDREHPLYVDPASTAANPLPLASSPPYSLSSQGVVNRIYMIKDFNTGKDAMDASATIPWWSPITEFGANGPNANPFNTYSLDDCTGTAAAPNTCSAATTGAATDVSYDKLTQAQQNFGYYITLLPGEKGVNAPLVTAGFVYLGTNQPTAPTPNSCSTNLGTARGYQLNPYTGQHASVIYAGGGLPPSPVSGIVDIATANGVVQAPFCIGCPPAINPTGSSSCVDSALAACKPNIQVNSARHRNYWYINNR
jgi:Tfp pilus tip-associated adhesin PilY1